MVNYSGSVVLSVVAASLAGKSLASLDYRGGGQVFRFGIGLHADLLRVEVQHLCWHAAVATALTQGRSVQSTGRHWLVERCWVAKLHLQVAHLSESYLL